MSSLLFFAVWPRGNLRRIDALRIGEAAARANVAWVITEQSGAVLDCNDAYRRLVGTKAGEAAPPPELALAGESAAANLYRLTHSASQGKPREEIITLSPGMELLGAVRPLTGGQAAWWFTPRLAPAAAGTPRMEPPCPPTPASMWVPLLRDAPVGVAVVDGTGKILEANDTFARFFGHPAQKLSLADLLNRTDSSKVADAIAGAAQDISTRVVEIGIAGESERMAELHVCAIGGQSEKFVILYLVDVSEQKALETKFAQSQKMQAVGQLAGGVAHDFNNLLTVIIGNSEFLLMRHAAGDPSFKEINEIHQNALRAATLVGQLLAFSRKQTLQPHVLALREVIAELAVMLRRLLREGVELKLDHGNELWSVRADETQISNAIINLVVNARDAMPRGGEVAIATANETVTQPAATGAGIMPPGDYVRIEVRDSGVGIPKEHLGKIFDPFFTTKPVGHGTGLGLATVYGIVKQTGGFLTVESQMGKGTTFRIYLPRYRTESAAPPEPERAAPRDITGEDTILLVEDEEAVRSFAARALKLRGYRVLEAAGGEEALEIVKQQRGAIHLLITDVVMPNMDGPTLVREVKRLRPDMAVIFMSGYAEEAFRRHDEKAEELHFLPKPFGLKQLAAKVKDVLSNAPEPKREST